jgi:hypothetical protein
MKKLFVLSAFIAITGITATHAIDCDRLIQRFEDEGITNAQDLMPSQLERLNSCIENSNGDANTATLRRFYPKVLENPEYNLGENSKYYDKDKYELVNFSREDIQDRSNYYDLIAIEVNYERFEEENEVQGKPGHYFLTTPNQACNQLLPKSLALKSIIRGEKIHNTNSRPVGIYVVSKRLKKDEVKVLREDRNVYVYEGLTCVKAKNNNNRIRKKDIELLISFSQVEVKEQRVREDARIHNGAIHGDEEAVQSNGGYWSGDWRVEIAPSVNR